MAEKNIPIIDKSLLSWVFEGNLKLKLLLLLTVVVAVIANVVPLEMQKRIVNESIERKSTDLLMVYCAVYLAAFVTASGLKFFINVMETVIGQNTVAEMRRRLYDHILKLPQGFFRRTQSGLIISSMTTELATAGDFVGMAVAVPLANLLTLVVFAGYLFWLNSLLAAVSFGVYPMVLLLVPQLQKRVNRANRKRVDAARSFSGRIGESIDGIDEVKANAAFGIERLSLGRRIDRLRKIRIVWKSYRFAVKVVNNLLTNFSRFLIFSLGGFLAINGRLELGALVAFLSAQEKLYVPWKELVRFYQAYQTAVVTYKRTMEYYAQHTEKDPNSTDKDTLRFKGHLEVENLSIRTAENKPLLRGASFSLQPGEHMALVGGSGSGKSTLVRCLMGLTPFFDGRCELDGRSVSEIDRRSLSANIGFVFQAPAIFSGTITDNLLYGCRALADPGDEDSLPDLNKRIEVLQQTGLFIDVLGFGLSARLDPEAHARVQEAVLKVRSRFRDQYAEKTRREIETYYDQNRYLCHSSVASNLLFGEPAEGHLSENGLPNNDCFMRSLRQAGLLEPLSELGARFGTQILEKFGTLSILLPTIAITRRELGSLKRTLKKFDELSPSELPERHRRKLLGLALHVIPAVHTLVEIPDSLRRQIVAGRKKMMKRLQEETPGAVRFYHPDAYIPKASIIENIIFGRITSENIDVKSRVHEFINRLLVEQELLETIIQIGMTFQVGRSGENLSGGQRQKLALARALLKDPSILLLDEATASLDKQSQRRIQKVLESQWKGKSTTVAVVHRLDIIENYDKIAVMDAGHIKEIGTYDELMATRGLLYRLAGDKSP